MLYLARAGQRPQPVLTDQSQITSKLLLGSWEPEPTHGSALSFILHVRRLSRRTVLWNTPPSVFSQAPFPTVASLASLSLGAGGAPSQPAQFWLLGDSTLVVGRTAGQLPNSPLRFLPRVARSTSCEPTLVFPV